MARRRYVVLEHRWDGVHWDLMLDVGDVLRTWAIDAPITTGVDLPARALGDHRRIYLDFEGELRGTGAGANETPLAVPWILRLGNFS